MTNGMHLEEEGQREDTYHIYMHIRTCVNKNKEGRPARSLAVIGLKFKVVDIR